MNINIEKITRKCYECNGEGELSACCHSEIDNDKCMICGKFCKKVSCSCYGNEDKFEIGTKVELFVSKYSSDELKKFFKLKDNVEYKTFKGKIIEIISYYDVLVKFKNRKEPLKVYIDNLEICE